jgi:hypothetical protein
MEPKVQGRLMPLSVQGNVQPPSLVLQRHHMMTTPSSHGSARPRRQAWALVDSVPLPSLPRNPDVDNLVASILDDVVPGMCLDFFSANLSPQVPWG